LKTTAVAASGHGPKGGPVSTTPVAGRGRQFTDLAGAVASVGGPRDWRFEGAIEGDPIVVWVGPEKSGKSWAALDAAVACATGGK
jgi:AAA domain